MSEQHGLNELRGCAIHATDGEIGKVREVYFDDQLWVVRYLVVNTGSWLRPRAILLAPQAVGRVDWAHRCIAAQVTREQVRTSPTSSTDMPVALQHQAELHKHYGWEVYWAAEALVGAGETPFAATTPSNTGGTAFDPHLRTTRVVTGLRVSSDQGELGHVVDFLFADDTWIISGLAVNHGTKGRVLVESASVRRISVEQGEMDVGQAPSQVLFAA